MMNDQQRARSVDAIRRAHAVMGSQTKLSFATGIAASRLSALINDQAVASATEAATIEKATNRKVTRADIRPDMFPSKSDWTGHDTTFRPGPPEFVRFVGEITGQAEFMEVVEYVPTGRESMRVKGVIEPATRAPAPNPQPPAAKVTDGKARSRQEPQAEGRKGKTKERKGESRRSVGR